MTHPFVSGRHMNYLKSFVFKNLCSERVIQIDIKEWDKEAIDCVVDRRVIPSNGHFAVLSAPSDGGRRVAANTAMELDVVAGQGGHIFRTSYEERFDCQNDKC